MKTGLVDKNGYEIYESDIVTDGKIKGRIVMKDNMWHFYSLNANEIPDANLENIELIKRGKWPQNERTATSPLKRSKLC